MFAAHVGKLGSMNDHMTFDAYFRHRGGEAQIRDAYLRQRGREAQNRDTYSLIHTTYDLLLTPS
jgi:hypothetical protein